MFVDVVQYNDHFYDESIMWINEGDDDVVDDDDILFILYFVILWLAVNMWNINKMCTSDKKAPKNNNKIKTNVI